MTDVDMEHLNYLKTVADRDVLHLLEKEKTYGGSWKKRGGVGAFMMLARKWDRLENFMKHYYMYNVFEGVKDHPDGEDGTTLAEIRDLRRYLLLVEAEMMARKVIPGGEGYPFWPGPAVQVEDPQVKKVPGGDIVYEQTRPGTPEDGGQHESTYPWITPTLIDKQFQ